MKEHSILFSGVMPLAILDGRKTQTRRIVRSQPDDKDQELKLENGWLMYRRAGIGWCKDTPCPYGQPGDRLWVREACWIWGRWSRNGFTATGRQKWRFTADSDHRIRFDKPDFTAKREALNGNVGKPGWVYRHARFMPRWASRILLEITNVRVERVQEIGDKDCLAEGISDLRIPLRPGLSMHRSCYADLWDSINAKRGYGWDVNPWVWVIEFKRIKP